MFEKIYDNNIKNVFFDIFDTILKRKVQPEYVKKIWANQINKIMQMNYNAIDLYKLRNKVEIELGEENYSNGFDCEVQYDKIIKKIYEKLKLDIPFDDFLQNSINIEINIESKVLTVDWEMINKIKELKKQNKKIYCISDMYLSKKMIESIFENLSILNLFNDIFISCEFLKNKKTGNLYDIVLNTLKVKPENCFMIGDNYYSDYEVPISKNIRSIHLNRNDQYKFYEEYEKKYYPKMVYENVCNISKLSSSDFSNSIFSLYTFIEKLYFELIKNDAKEVFFLSREGEFLKKLFDYYCDNIYGKKILSHYLYVSRKATYLPSLKKIDKENFSSLLNQYSYISILEFLKSLNFSEKEIRKIILSYEKDANELFSKFINDENQINSISHIITNDANQKIPNFIKSGSLKLLKSNKLFREIFEKNRCVQKNNFINYIKEQTKNKKIIVVDIGWNGSIQNNIQNILGQSYQVDGYYFGMNRRNPKENIKKVGLMFTTEPKNKEFDLFNQNRSLYEIILGASHGSATKYVNKNGSVDVELLALKEEKKIYKDIISPLQKNMFEIFSLITQNLVNGYYNNQQIAKLFNKIQFKMLFKPNKEQINFFNKIYHYENFGVFQFTEFKNKSKVGFKIYIKENLKFILKYNQFFDDSFWPVLKLKNEKLFIPYYIYKYTKNIKFKIKKIM